MENQNYKTCVADIRDIIKNVEGSAVQVEIETVLDDYAEYLAVTPIPVSVVKWFENLFDLLDNCDGSELERELKGVL